jgi:hypothetical protein
VNLFREYFYEFDSYLGPPEGHVWISPGGSLELYEVHTRRTVEDKLVEIGTETITKSESSQTNQDELSSAVSEDNSRNISLGVTVSAGANTGVYHADASANLGLTFNHQSSEQSAHKQMREQSEKLSNEIRRNFKTTYRTTVEVQDTSSRRYVLQNTTNALVNYELRRKMRKVGVQVQHISTQLCWQLYVDNPGETLGISELVHVAKRDDLSSAIQSPDAPTSPPVKTTDLQVNFDYENTTRDDGTIFGGGPRNDDDNRYQFGKELDAPSVNEAHNRVVWQREYEAPPPLPGYELTSISELSFDKVDATQGLPTIGPAYATRADDPSLPPTKFRVSMNYLVWNNQNAIRLTLRLVWSPPQSLIDAAESAYQAKIVEFTEGKRRAAHADYLAAVRERIKLESNISPRRSDDLREEERTIIYRWLLQQLTKAGVNQTPHVTAELIRSIFDVDKMLYFVAPEWWLPHTHYHQQTATPKKATAPALTPHLGILTFGGPATTPTAGGSSVKLKPAAQALSFDDVVGWGGVNEANRDNYLITEDSEPAPLGASLGWLIQLDGDARRNTFLNSPWVKAILPIRPGKEEAALNWLSLGHVEGTDGLDEPYQGTEEDLQGKTIREAVLALGAKVAELNTDIKNVLATETVYEKGFDPLEGGFQATGTPFEIFDQWIEVLPTDQTVAVDYKP